MLRRQIEYSFYNNKPVRMIYIEEKEIVQNSVQVLKIYDQTIQILDVTEQTLKTLSIDSILSAMDTGLCQSQ